MPLPATERRKSMRFGLTLPIHVVQLSKERVELDGETRDVSSAGAYFVIDDRRFAPGVAIEFLVSFPPRSEDPADARLRLRCRGRVTRIEEAGEQRGVAATIDRYKFVRPDQA